IFSPSIPTVTSIPTIPIPTVIPSETTPIRKYTRRARIAQSSTLLPIADEPASSVRDASQGEAFPTDSGFIADQDRATIAKSSTLPYDSEPMVTSPAAKEGTQEVEINMLKERVKILEDKRGVIEDRSRDDAPIKGKRIDEEEVATERVSSDTEEVRLDKREGKHNIDFHPMVDFVEASPLRTYSFSKMIFDGLDKNINNKGEGSGTPTESHHTPSLEAQPSSHTHISSPLFPTVTTISTALIPTVTPFETTSLRQYTRRARIAQSSALPPVADEPASPVRDVSQEEACPTESGFIADQDRTTIAKSSTLPHDSATRVTSPAAAQEVEINKLKERVKLLEDGKGMAAEGYGDDAPIKGRRLDKEEVATKRVSSDTEEIRLDEGEVATEKVSDDTEEMATVLITMDAASVLSSGGVQVVPTAAAVAPANVNIPTSSGVVPTASTTISTATPIFATATTVTPYTRRKGKEKMELEREAQRMNAQITRDEEITKIHAKEELQQMIAGLDRSNETIAKHLEEYDQSAAELTIEERIELISELVKYQDHHSKILKYQAQQRKSRTKKQKRDFYMAVIRNNLGWKVKDFKGMSFEEVEAKFKTVWEQIKGGVFKIPEGEAAWLKRKGIRSEQESVKKQKTTEEVPEEVQSYDEIPEEKIKELIRLVPIEEVYVESLQVKHHIIDRKVHTEGQRSYWKITRWSIKFRGGLLGIKCTRHSHCQLQSSHCQKKFPLPEKKDATARRKEKPLPERSHCYQCQEETVSQRWQLR
nr:hypothetical protein [Tanacetum cinerariifolium]